MLPVVFLVLLLLSGQSSGGNSPSRPSCWDCFGPPLRGGRSAARVEQGVEPEDTSDQHDADSHHLPKSASTTAHFKRSGFTEDLTGRIHEFLPAKHTALVDDASKDGIGHLEAPTQKRKVLAKLYHKVGCFMPEPEDPDICRWPGVTCEFGREPFYHITELDVVCRLPNFGTQHSNREVPDIIVTNEGDQRPAQDLPTQVIDDDLEAELAQHFGKLTLTVTFGARMQSGVHGRATDRRPVLITGGSTLEMGYRTRLDEQADPPPDPPVRIWQRGFSLSPSLFFYSYFYHNGIWFHRNSNADPQVPAERFQFVGRAEPGRVLGNHDGGHGYTYPIPDPRMGRSWLGMTVYMAVAADPSRRFPDIWGPLTEIEVHLKVFSHTLEAAGIGRRTDHRSETQVVPR